MHRAVTTVIVVLALLCTASPADADSGGGYTRCDNESCEAQAIREHHEDGTGSSAPTDPLTLPCTYRPMDVPADHAVYSPDGTLVEVDGTGQWYERICTLQGFEVIRDAMYIHPANPVELREEARERLVFPTLPVTLNPARHQTVNFRSLLWVEPTTWAPVSATATVPGVSVTVAATPIHITWSMGDGGKVECNGPGVPYNPDKSEEDQDTSCSYVYRHSSAGQPGEVFRLTTTVQWALSWSVTGAAGGGTLGVVSRTSPAVDVRVVEVQAVNTASRDR